MRLRVDASSPIPIRRQLTEQVKHLIDAGTFPRNHALPSIRQLATELEVNPNTIARVVEDLKRDGYVLAHRGRGVFVAPNPPARPSPSLRDAFLKDVVIRGAALGMNADEVAVGVLSLARVRPAPLRRPATVLLVECSSEVLDFFANEIESHLPVHVDKVLLGELSAVVRRRKRGRRWAAAVTSFFHLPEVERRVGDKRVPVIPLLASAHLATLHRLAQLPPGTRIGVVTEDAGFNWLWALIPVFMVGLLIVGLVRSRRRERASTSEEYIFDEKGNLDDRLKEAKEKWDKEKKGSEFSDKEQARFDEFVAEKKLEPDINGNYYYNKNLINSWILFWALNSFSYRKPDMNMVTTRGAGGRGGSSCVTHSCACVACACACACACAGGGAAGCAKKLDYYDGIERGDERHNKDCGLAGSARYHTEKVS